MTTTNRVFALLLFVVLLMFAPSALAVDGVVLINQNTSVAGIPGCPHAGFPLMICQSGSYRLTGNLTVPDANTDGIDITADNVTLDLNGFTIAGPVTCTPGHPVPCSATGTGKGISSIDHVNLTVRNGTVRGMGNDGINFSVTNFIDIFVGTGALVDQVHVSSNGGSGISVIGGNVTHCNVRLNKLVGIALIGGNASFNTVSANGGAGISGDDFESASNNSVSDNGESGIRCVGTVLNNGIFFNVGFGIDDSCFTPGGSASGYFAGNAMHDNGFSVSNGGRAVSAGNNNCDGSLC